MGEGQRRLGALLLEMGVIDEEQLDRALEEQRRSGRRLGRVLVEAGLVEERPLVDALAKQLGLERWNPNATSSDPTARTLISRDLAVRARVLPLMRRIDDDRDTVFMATSDPLAPGAGKVVRSMSERGALVRWLLAGESELELAIVAAYDNVQVIQGRPEKPPQDPTPTPLAVPHVTPTPELTSPFSSSSSSRPEAPPAASPLKAPSPTEEGLIEALDAALGAADGHPVVEPRRSTPSSAAVPALTVGTSVRSGHTLVADDAVLEIVDVTPGEVSTLSQPPDLGLDPSEPEKTKESPHTREWARAARTPHTNWGELVPSEEGASEEDSSAPSSTWDRPEVTPSRPESVALGRVAIKRSALGGVREVVSPELRARDPRESTGVGFVESNVSDDQSEPESVPAPAEPPSLDTPPISSPILTPSSIELGARGEPETSSDPIELPELEVLGEDVLPEADTDDVKRGEDDGGFGGEPTVVVANPSPPKGAPPELPIEPPSGRPTHDGDDWATIDAPAPSPSQAPALSPNSAPSPSWGAPPPLVAQPTSTNVGTAEKAAELHATLVRFAGGESLSDERRNQILRVVVKSMLERGELEEAALVRWLED